MSDQPRSKIGPLTPEEFDGDAFVRDDGEVEKSYSEEINTEFDDLLNKLKKPASIVD